MITNQHGFDASGLTARAQARQDCVTRGGDCRGCPHALESMGGSCMIRYTDSVVRALGAPEGPMPDRYLPAYDCADCGAEFRSISGKAWRCQPCGATYSREKARAYRAKKKAERETRAAG